MVWVTCFNCGKRWKSNGIYHKYECPKCTMVAEGLNKLQKETIMKEDITKEIMNSVTQYVWANYKQYKDKPLIIREYDNHFKINMNKDGSPLILGKGIVDEK